MDKSQEAESNPPVYTPYPQSAGGAYPPPAGAAYPPPAGGVYPPPAGAAYPAAPAGQTVIVTQTGNCPHCHAGFMVETFSLCGILWLILCFPCGLICFLTMKDKKCGTCGYEVHT